MLDSIGGIFKKMVGSKADRDLRELSPIVEDVSPEFDNLQSVSNDELRARTAVFKEKINDHIKEEQDQVASLKASVADNDDMDDLQKEDVYEQVDKLEEKITEKIEEVLEEIMPEAFAVVKETARRFKENDSVEVTATNMDRDLAASRDGIVIQGDKAIWQSTWLAAGGEITWDMVHYDCQLIGGRVLHQGKAAEMATGEGKTLVATLPVYLNALPRRGVHLVTVNNYLAKRDSEWMGPMFEFHGLTVDCIDKHQPNSEERRQAYLADVTYGTNNEFGFDYLRDNMATAPEDLVQRKHNYAIVDEVDSVLIDEARTPLIISGPTPKGDQHQFNELKPKIEKLVKAQRQYITTALSDAKSMMKKLDEEGGSLEKKKREELDKNAGLALLRSFRGLPKNKALIKYLSEEGVRTYLKKTENIYLADNQKLMPEVDQELYFTIDEQNNSIEMSEKGIDLIADSAEDREFFIMPDMGSLMADIDNSEMPDREKLQKKDDLLRDYTVKTERIHTINQLLKAYTLFEKDIEYVIMENKVKIVDEQTGRIMDGRRYSDGLHQAIEAKENVKIEAATQTYATITLQNYFRMYSKLAGMTGTAETEAGELWEIYKLDVVVIPTNRPIVRDDREDLVYKTKREKYNAVADEIVALVEAGRPVLVGTTSVEVSELLSRMLKIKNIDHQVLNAKLHQREAEVVTKAGQAGTVTIATNMAGRGTDIKLGTGVKEAGGLAIIGTERHDSRRVDRQLRGRSGRQGDPGSSQFFVSLEDDLMRLFGSDRIAKLMDRMGLEEGEVIQHSMISKSIERAQKKVEENNFGIRKRLLEYDDVMNNQREGIYKKRRHALHGERLSLDIANSTYEVCESIANEFQEYRDFEGFNMELIKVLGVESPITEDEFIQMNVDEITDRVYGVVRENYKRKVEFSAEAAFPVIKDVYENQSATYQNIVVPFSDGLKTLQVVTNLERSYSTRGKELIHSLEKSVTLAMIDQHWKDHLLQMDELKQNVQEARWEQKDPLLIYKFEGFEMFKKMRDGVNKEIVQFLTKAQLPTPDPSQVKEAEQRRPDMSNLQTKKEEFSQPQLPQPGMPQDGQMPPQQQPKAKPSPVRVEKKVGRNDPCPCGSGKKYKQCHGKAGATTA